MTLLILCLAALAIVAVATSCGVGLGLRLFRKPIQLLAPAAQARLYLLAAALPCLVSLAVLMTALAPSFGWIADHCDRFGDSHLHAHICANHHVAVWPAIPLIALALALLLRVALTVMGLGKALWEGHLARRALDRIGTGKGPSGAMVLPVDEPQAFVLGLFQPTLYVTRGLVFGGGRHHLQAVLAHELAHISRMDPLLSFIAGMGLAFHLPGVASWLTRRQATAQEMAADEAAAQTVGSRTSIAHALVALARARCAHPAGATAFSGTDIEVRVDQLLGDRKCRDTPKGSTLSIVAVLALVALAASADAVHHGVELLLGVLGS